MSDLDAGLRPDDGPTTDPPPLDLDRIERDLRDVESALARLADGTFFETPVASVPGTSATSSPIDAQQRHDEAFG